jgi:hypothetical protein
MTTNGLSRSLHDVGLAAWFGGTLANAVGLNPAAAQAATAGDTGAVANVGWDRWTPVNAAAIGAHLAGGLAQLVGNSGRLGAQRGVGRMALLKTGLTVAALGVTAYSRALGHRVSADTHVPAESGTRPATSTSGDVAAAQRQLRTLQWVVPVLTGALVVLSSYAGVLQRPTSVLQGIVDRVTP